MCVHSEGAAECIVSLTGAIAGVVRAQRLGDAREARPPARPSVAVMWRGVAAYVDLRVVKKKSGAATQKALS